MARPAKGRDVPTAWTRMPSGKTLSQEIRGRGGVTGKARGARSRFSNLRAGDVPFTLEDMLPPESLQKLKHGDSQRDNMLLDQYQNGRTVNPFRELPARPNTNELREVVSLYDDAGEYYEPDIGETYNNYAANPIRPGTEKYLGQPEGYTSASALSEVPTSTTNPDRPRTVGAGFQIDKGDKYGKLTVVFRDGTYYNYYQVTPREWNAFKARVSKGKYIRAYLDSHPRGVANSSNIDPVIRQQLYRVLETAQRYSEGRPRKQKQTKSASTRHSNPRPRRR